MTTGKKEYDDLRNMHSRFPNDGHAVIMGFLLVIYRNARFFTPIEKRSYLNGTEGVGPTFRAPLASIWQVESTYLVLIQYESTNFLTF